MLTRPTRTESSPPPGKQRQTSYSEPLVTLATIAPTICYSRHISPAIWRPLRLSQQPATERFQHYTGQLVTNSASLTINLPFTFLASSSGSKTNLPNYVAHVLNVKAKLNGDDNSGVYIDQPTTTGSSPFVVVPEPSSDCWFWLAAASLLDSPVSRTAANRAVMRW